MSPPLAIVMEKSFSAARWSSLLAPLPESLKTSFTTESSLFAEQCATVVSPSSSVPKVASATRVPSLSKAMTLRWKPLGLRMQAGMPAALASFELMYSCRSFVLIISCVVAKSLPS